jgi:hypothetical protein
MEAWGRKNRLLVLRNQRVVIIIIVVMMAVNLDSSEQKHY